MANRENWIKIKTSAFFNFYSLGQEINDKIYFKKCDIHIRKVCKIFGFNVDRIRNIKYYILPGRNEYKQILGRSSYGEIKNNCLYSVYPFHPHEITHIVINKFLGKGKLKILSEGIAVLYGWNNNGAIWQSNPLEYWLKEYYKDVDLVQLIKNFKSFNSKISYPIAGCFVNFLIEEFGVSNFKKLYRRVDDSMLIKEKKEIVKKITNMTIEELVVSFYDYYKLNNL